MIDENLARLRAHRNNIIRYRNLLETRLSDIERQFITQRLSEETAALQRLPQSDFPIYVSEPPRTSTGEHAH
jgi:hypothetical protein